MTRFMMAGWAAGILLIGEAGSVASSHDADIFDVVGDAREIKRRVDPHAPEDIQKVYLNELNMVTGPPVKALMVPGSRRSKRAAIFPRSSCKR